MRPRNSQYHCQGDHCRAPVILRNRDAYVWRYFVNGIPRSLQIFRANWSGPRCLRWVPLSLPPWGILRTSTLISGCSLRNYGMCPPNSLANGS